jgi:type VII secretion protein EccE
MTARLALALLFVVPAAMAYPWSTTFDRWLLGVAVAVVLVLFAWWRGAFVTTIVGRRLAMFRRNHTKVAEKHARIGDQSNAFTTVVLRVNPSEQDALPLPLIAGYLDRYGIRCDKVRITSHDSKDERITWIGLTLGAADNLAALRARSPQLPLRETAEIAGRRLADHLRETGWDVTIVDTAKAPAPAVGRETWRGMRDESEYVAAYRVAVDDRLAETLAAIRAQPSSPTWTALEITGTAADPRIAAGCALRWKDRPAAKTPLPGLTPLHGRHHPALDALDPLSVQRLDAVPVPLPDGLLDGLVWPVGGKAEPIAATNSG